jgi:hypothetical protein
VKSTSGFFKLFKKLKSYLSFKITKTKTKLKKKKEKMFKPTKYTLLFIALYSILISIIQCECVFNKYEYNVIHVGGDFSELSKIDNWSPSDPKGRMMLNATTCYYSVIIKDLKPNANYNYKVRFFLNVKKVVSFRLKFL